MANKERGEVTINLDGKAWTMRPTYEALAEIEAATGRPIMELIGAVNALRFSVRDLAVIVAACLRAGGEDGVKAARVGPMLVAAGITSPAVLGPVVEMLTGTLTGGADPEKKE